MADPGVVAITINGRAVRVHRGTTVAAAVAQSGEACRMSTSGQLRAPLCGMGICFECRVMIDGEPHIKGCQVLCSEGMEIQTDG